jgi:hypothetical protein
MGFLAVATATVLSVHTFAVAQQGKKEYLVPLAPTAADPSTPAAAAAFTGSGFGWFSPDGAFDGRGRFDEHLGTFFVANARQYNEDRTYCMYQETSNPTWRWALAKIPYQPNRNAIWLSLNPPNMPEQWVQKADGIKLNRAGDP